MGDKIDNRGIKDGLSAYATLALSMSAQATGSTVRLSNLICGLPGFDPDRTERVMTEASRASDRGQSLLHLLQHHSVRALLPGGTMTRADLASRGASG
jgi:hypothetical protein